MLPITLEQVKTALALQPPEFKAENAQLKMAPRARPLRRDIQRAGEARLAATLLLLFPDNDAGLKFVLTRRRDDLVHHAGQISFPGGRKEADEAFSDAALRETCEELGICGTIELLGELTELYIPPSDFQVRPFVGYIPNHPEWHFSTDEVAEVIEAPVNILLDDALKKRGTRELDGATFEYGWYDIQGHQVWGATAVMLSEFEWRLRSIL